MSLAGRVSALEREVAELRQIVERLSLQLEESESSPFSVVREQAVGSGTSVPRPPSATSARADPALSFSPASRSSPTPSSPPASAGPISISFACRNVLNV